MIVATKDVPEHMARVHARYVDLDLKMNLKIEDMGPVNHASEYRLLKQALNAPSKTKSVLWLRRAVETVAIQVQSRSACATGCSHCCNIAVDVSKTEALMIAKAIGRKVDSRVLDGVVTKQHPMSWYGQPCPFLHAGQCSVYEHRPVACRTQFNMDDDDLLCMLVQGEEIRVPYLDMMDHKLAYAEAVSTNEVCADIRQWFPASPEFEEVALPTGANIHEE